MISGRIVGNSCLIALRQSCPSSVRIACGWIPFTVSCLRKIGRGYRFFRDRRPLPKGNPALLRCKDYSNHSAGCPVCCSGIVRGFTKLIMLDTYAAGRGCKPWAV